MIYTCICTYYIHISYIHIYICIEVYTPPRCCTTVLHPSSTGCNYKLLAESQVAEAERRSKAMRPHQMLVPRCKLMWTGNEAENSLIAVCVGRWMGVQAAELAVTIFCLWKACERVSQWLSAGDEKLTKVESKVMERILT